MSKPIVLDGSIYKDILVHITSSHSHLHKDGLLETAIESLKCIADCRSDNSYKSYEVYFPNRSGILVSKYGVELLLKLLRERPELLRPYDINREFLTRINTRSGKTFDVNMIQPFFSSGKNVNKNIKQYSFSEYHLPILNSIITKEDDNEEMITASILPMLLAPIKDSTGFPLLPKISYVTMFLDFDEIHSVTTTFCRRQNNKMHALKTKLATFDDDIYFTMVSESFGIADSRDHGDNFTIPYLVMGIQECRDKINKNFKIHVLWLENTTHPLFKQIEDDEYYGDEDKMAESYWLLDLEYNEYDFMSGSDSYDVRIADEAISFVEALQSGCGHISTRVDMQKFTLINKPDDSKLKSLEYFQASKFRYIPKECIQWGELGEYPFQEAVRMTADEDHDYWSLARNAFSKGIQFIHGYLSRYDARQDPLHNSRVLYQGNFDLHEFLTLEELNTIECLDLTVTDPTRTLELFFRKSKNDILTYYRITTPNSNNVWNDALSESDVLSEVSFKVDYYCDVSKLPKLKFEEKHQSDEFIIRETTFREPVVYYGSLYVNSLGYFLSKYRNQTNLVISDEKIDEIETRFQNKAIIIHPKFYYQEDNIRGLFRNLIDDREQYQYPIVESNYIYPKLFGDKFQSIYKPRELDSYILSKDVDKLLSTGMDRTEIERFLSSMSNKWLALENSSIYYH